MNTIDERIQELSPEKLERFAQILRQKQHEKKQREQERIKIGYADKQYDVVILGGGLAGLTLARQLKQRAATINILVVEKQQTPVPEVAFKVGESLIELGAHYLSEVIGCSEHLRTAQLRKAGLRFFFRAGDNRDITRRVEIGNKGFPPIPTYQIDRGRFENMLREEVVKQGVALWDQCTVQQITLDAPHTITLRYAEEEYTVAARWVVDASGRTGLLKRQLGLTKSAPHTINSVWFRIDEPIDVANWSPDLKWQTRIPPHIRRLSTNHLVGHGYWVWLIPLPSGATSVGIVADTTIHPHNQLNRIERALAWLEVHEPQCASVVKAHLDKLQDFRALRDCALGCEQVYSTDRWCLTGEAGLFLDPLYSLGSDFIGIGNTYITDLIVRDLNGEEIADRVAHYNATYLKFFELCLLFYKGQYHLIGNTPVMFAKLLWDISTHWGFFTLLFFQNKLCDLALWPAVEPLLDKLYRLNSRMQARLAEWGKVDYGAMENLFLPYQEFDFIIELFLGLKSKFTDQALIQQLQKNLDLLESLETQYIQMFATPGNGNKGQAESETRPPLAVQLLSLRK